MKIIQILGAAVLLLLLAYSFAYACGPCAACSAKEKIETKAAVSEAYCGVSKDAGGEHL